MRVSRKLSLGVSPLLNAVCEALEDRQLMSLTVEVRNADGSATATAGSVGQVITLDVLAVIDSGSNPAQDGLQDLTGSFISTALGKHSVAGDLSAANLAPFDAQASAGTLTDLNGDGNRDVGSNDPNDPSQYFFAQASPLQGSSGGTIVGSTLVFQIATLSYTVTRLNEGGQTSINFVPFVSPTPDSAGWEENGTGLNNTTGTFQAGTPFVVSDPILVTAPTAASSSANVAENTSSNLYVLSNVDAINPLDPATLTVVTNPAHGTAVAVAEGLIVYTPFTSYTGYDSFTYTVADTDGRISNQAGVNLSVVSTPSPVAFAVAVSTYRNQQANINVLSEVTTQATLVPSSVTIVSAATHGSTTVQSDGSISYTPGVNFAGTDSFQYIASDSNGENSNPATVTVTVTNPQLPMANDDSISLAAGTSTSVNLQANDIVGSVALTGLVQIVDIPRHGTVATQTGGAVLYTPAAGFSGTDSFTYTDTDILGNASNLATVNVTVTPGTPPNSTGTTQQVLSGQATGINVLAGQTGAIPSTVTLAQLPAHGSAAVNADGTITYTSTAGFVGGDSFAFTFSDAGGGTAPAATVNLQVGTAISNIKGAAHSLRFTDAAGGVETISLNLGTANLYFAGSGTVIVPKNGKATITGSGMNLSSIALSETTRASSLSIAGSPKAPVNVGGITNTAPLGSINAISANITGDIHLGGARTITVGNVTGSTMTIGGAVPGKFSLTTSAVSDSSLRSAVPSTAIKSGAWTGTGEITAPSIASLTIKTGGLAANISTGVIGTLSIGGSLTGNITATSIKSVKVTGDINGSTLALDGVLNQFIAASLTNTTLTDPAGNVGSIHLTGKTGDDFTDSNITAGKITALSLGNIATSNGGKSFGITTPTLGSFAGIFGTVPLHAGRTQLANTAVLKAFAAQQGVVFGDFAIQLGG